MAEIDLHEIRSALKLLHDTGTSAHYENRGGAHCPVCGDRFDEAIETSERTRQFDPSVRLSFCLVNEADKVVLFTHA